MRAAGALVVACLATFVAGAASCGGGSSGPSASGSLSVRGCTIAEGGGSCAGSITWTTVAATSPRVVIGSTTVASTASGTLAPSLTPGAQTVTLLDGETRLAQATITALCAAATSATSGTCRRFAERLVERAETPFVENGRAVTLEVVLYRPLAAGPHPALLFHHGSTGDGTDPSLFTQTYTSENVAQFFVERGYLVAFPQRRGRGASDGLYDEGFTPDRSRYSCVFAQSVAGFEHAMADVDAAVAYMKRRSDVIPSRLVNGGASRGGVLALTYAAERPGTFEAAVNFVGGWLGEGCADGPAVNRSLFTRAAAYSGPTIWMYGANDTFYSLTHSRSNYDAFVAARGRGLFFTYTRAAGLNGHNIIADPFLWTGDLSSFVQSIGR